MFIYTRANIHIITQKHVTVLIFVKFLKTVAEKYLEGLSAFFV